MDHVVDANGTELARLGKLYQFPPFVKQADWQTVRPDGQTPSHLFGDPRRRLFPCHNPASTWLSCLYFQEKQASLPAKDRERIRQRLDHYVRYWGIKEAVDALKQRYEALHADPLSRLPDEHFAFVRVRPDGTKERRLPLRTPLEVKTAAQWLQRWRDAIPFAERHKMAVRIVERSRQVGADLRKEAEFLEQQLGLGVCDPKEVAALIRQRASWVRSSALKQAFAKMAQTVESRRPELFETGQLVKLASTLDQLDRQMGWHHYYARGWQRPEDVIFKLTFTKAGQEVARLVATHSGRIYDKNDLARIGTDQLTAVFGPDFTERVTDARGRIHPAKLAEEVATLPRPDAEILDDLARQCGIRPVEVKAASSRQGFSPQQWAAWARIS